MPTQSEAIKQDIDQLTAEQLQQVADFIAFLKFRRKRHLILAPEQLASLAEDAAEDRALAEAGMSDYLTLLHHEDQQ
ncbi:hypothetical protein [Rivularia sp. UHCC 0363]|uniref:hypothetical protein n=1 Tax=Rivularia sp. UHCC 0363 TaxID=3110244 RepID=UPI002B20304F|nr:hypothetical protein [Rivularia sp. UHCC 0363]MEA5599323.1 hypothetical protein [Rivularia sp. UHCC 0363]